MTASKTATVETLTAEVRVNALVTNASQRPPYLIVRRTGGRSARHVIFHRETIDPEGAGT